MSLADAVQNPFAVQRFFVSIDGTEIAALGMKLVEPPTINEALGQFCATCELQFSSVSAFVRVGAQVQVVESLDGINSTIFTGKIMRPAGTSWPPRKTLWCNDVLWAATLPATADQEWENTDDATVIEEALESVGITDHNILSSNWTLGTLYRLLLPRKSTVAALIQRIDELASHWTLASGSGLVYRIPLPLYPGAPTAAAFAYARAPAEGEYKVFDASLEGDGIEQIRNQVEVTGARLTTDYEADALDEVAQGFAYDTPIELSQLPLLGSVIVTSDPSSGSVVFVEGDDYEIDYVGTGDPLVGTITILSSGDIIQTADFHTPLSVSYDYVQEESGGQITASAAADNAYLPPDVRLVLSISDDLIQDFTQAATIATDKLRENNRNAKRLTLRVRSNPALRIGQTITYRDANLELEEDTSFLVISITRQGKYMTVVAIGGDGGEVDYLDPRAPIADFDYIAVRVAGGKVYVWLNAERAWDPDGDIASYTWQDDQANTASGIRAGFVYDLVDGNTVTISLTVEDATGLESAVLARTINLLGSQADINTGRYQYARAVWYDAADMFSTGPNGTASLAYTPAANNPLSRYYGPLWRLMDQRGRVLRPTLSAGAGVNESYLQATSSARTYTSWLSSNGLLVYQDGDDIVLQTLDVAGTLVPTSLSEDILEDYELPPVVAGLNGLDWCAYAPSDPATKRVVSQSHILESPHGEAWREVLAAAGYGGNWRGMAATAFDAAYALDTLSTTPIVMSDGSQPEFPEPVEVFDLGAWYTSSRYIINCRWILEKADGEWTVRADPIEYAGYIEPQVGGIYPPLEVDSRVDSEPGVNSWRAIPYPAVDDLFFLGGGVGLDELGIFGSYGTYLYALTSDGSPAQQVGWFVNDVSERPVTMPSVGGPSVAPIDAVEVISDDNDFLCLVSDTEPVGWRDVDYDDSGWAAVVELGD